MTIIRDGGAVEHQPVSGVTVQRGRTTIGGRILGVAALSILIASVTSLAIAFPLVRGAATAQAQEELAQRADLVADLVEREVRTGGIGFDGRELNRILERDMVVITVTDESRPAGPVTQAHIDALLEGENLSVISRMGNQSYFLEGRAIEIESEDSELEFAVIVAQPTVITIGPIQELITRMALATFAGLAVALAIGYVVAERTARPLKSAAAAARRMATGERNIDVEVKGALEVADISEALNQLSSHLAHSENRQREFFMSVSHELRTPLTAMKAYGEALQDGVIPTSDLPRVGGVLVQETDRLTRLVSDLLELGRAQAVDFPLVESTCDVAELLSLAASSWKLRCQKEAIDFDFHSESIVMQTDPVRLRQIVDNLVENALRVTPDHGRIQLSVQSDSEDVLITVDDSGPGLADEDFAVAFEPAMLFSKYQGQRPVGTGLGLALVQRLVHRMGGTIHATHSPLGGARFVVRLPASQPGD